MSAEFFVGIAAALCAGPVLVGFVVTRWVKWWSRPQREGPLTCRD